MVLDSFFTDPNKLYGNGATGKLYEVQGRIYRDACMLIIPLLEYGDYQYPEEIDFNKAAYQGNTPNNVRIIRDGDPDAIDYSFVVYINSAEGWKLTFTSDVAMFSESADLYRTIDGGGTWEKINNTEMSVPLTTKTGITFINNKIGWITTTSPADFIGFYRTIDGGLTWTLQEVDIPEKYNLCSYDTRPPVFFSKDDGVLLTIPHGSESDEYYGKLVYITHDGGESWIATTENTKGDKLSWVVDDNTWIITYDNAIWESRDGCHWNVSK